MSQGDRNGRATFLLVNKGLIWVLMLYSLRTKVANAKPSF